MQIDWFTVGAQILNFLVLVALLKRFLYAPVVEAMAARERRIADRLEQAAEREQQARDRDGELQERLAQLDGQREEMLAGMREEVSEQRERLTGELREEIAQQRARWQEENAREREELAGRLRSELAESVLEVSRRVLADLADERLEGRVVDAFVRRLRELEPDDRRALAQAREAIVVASGFALDDEQRDTLARALREAVADEARRSGPDVRWERDASLLCGLRVRADGVELAWSVDDYLGELGARVAERLSRAGQQS